VDRGFISFKEYMEKEEQKLRFPNLKIITPVDTRDQSGRYSKEEVDKSRIEVTSIRASVEQVHGAQKHWLSLRNRQTLKEYFQIS
jgi:hypothetical protein